jgi:hypothetical protein
MAYEKRDMSGSVFRNRDKRSETHSDFTGDCLIEGQEYWMNCWEKKDKNGNSFFSFSFKKKQPRGDTSEPAKTQSKHSIEDIDDRDLPF